MYYCTNSYPSEIRQINTTTLKSENMYKEMQKAKKDGKFRFRCSFSSAGYLWSAYVYFDEKYAIDELIDKKYEWVGKKECEKQELINEIFELKNRRKDLT